MVFVVVMLLVVIEGVQVVEELVLLVKKVGKILLDQVVLV